MSAIKYSPYIPNVDAWVDYFKNQPREYGHFYTIGRPKQKGEEMEAVKLVTPTEQAVEQARARMRRESDDDILIFDRKNKAKRIKRVIKKSTSKRKTQKK